MSHHRVFSNCNLQSAICNLLALVSLLIASRSLAQDVASGPDVGTKTPALKVFDATGPHKGNEVDYTADRAAKPTVFLFIQADKWDRPMARFLRELDRELAKQEAYAVAVWLTEDVDKSKNYLPLAHQSLQLEATALTCHTGDRSGPAGWVINTDAHLTALVAHQSKIAARFGYQSLNETNVPEIIAALKKARGK